MSIAASFFCHPLALADALDNAVIIGNGTGRSLNDNGNSCPVVMLSLEDGILWVYGAGRFTMGRTRVDIEVDEFATAEIAISVKSAKALQSLLRQPPAGSDATAAVVIYDEPIPVMDEEAEDEDDQVIWVDVVISKNGKEIASLGDADPEGKWSRVIDMVDARLNGIAAPKPGPLALTIEDVNRLSSLRHKSRVIDFSSTDVEGVTAFRAGMYTVGIVGEVNREKFLSLGGGTEEDLWVS